MSDILYQRIKDNLEVLKMKSTLTTLDNWSRPRKLYQSES